MFFLLKIPFRVFFIYSFIDYLTHEGVNSHNDFSTVIPLNILIIYCKDPNFKLGITFQSDDLV